MNKDLYSKYWDDLKKGRVLPEYPRPQFARDSYLNLNGYWDYRISKKADIPESYDGRILVPFPLESLLSEATRSLQPDEYLIYHRLFTVSENFLRDRVYLHFGAVDQDATVYLNGKKLGKHRGGYWPFSFDVSKILKEENELVVVVQDPTDKSHHAFGKQSSNPKMIWYTPVSGIWQTVWLESVPENHLLSLETDPDFASGTVKFRFETQGPCEGELRVFDEDKLLVFKKIVGPELTIRIPDFSPWSPENPHLYDVEVRIGEDVVKSYFAFRKISIGDGPYGKCLFLNDEPYFLNGVLDQGFFSDGLYTPASDQAYVDDILAMKALGFNTLRKHIKIEPLRFYYHCDRLGMIVWQDMVNGGRYSFWKMTALPTFGLQRLSDVKNLGSFGRDTEDSRETFREEMRKTVELLRNVPSVCFWTIFNEGWGQFHSLENYEILKKMDPTRIIDSASGWFDQGAPDLASKHIYFKKLRFQKEERPLVLSEFGGYSCHIKEHSVSDKEFGYKKFPSLEKYEQAFIDLYEEQVIPSLKKGLAAAIYTQLSDVETETNGILTYDRKVCKLNPERVRKVNEKLRF